MLSTVRVGHSCQRNKNHTFSRLPHENRFHIVVQYYERFPQCSIRNIRLYQLHTLTLERLKYAKELDLSKVEKMSKEGLPLILLSRKQ